MSTPVPDGEVTTAMPGGHSLMRRLAGHLALERNVAAASAAVLLLGLGEELWKQFLPKYLEALGAGTVVIGLFGTTKDFFDAIYQYPGGWIADSLGRRRAFLIFIVLASAGYLVFLVSPSWPFAFLGLAFVMVWTSMGSPAIFAVIGDALPKAKRAMGFTMWAILKRVPMTVAPTLGGLMIASLGIVIGVRLGLAITLALAAVAALAAMAIRVQSIEGPPTRITGVWRSFQPQIKRLLVSDIIIRMCEGLAEVLIVLYATNILGVGLAQFGILVAVQRLTSILVYLPAARIADRIGRKPFVVATFLCFSLFPVAVAFSNGFAMLVVAFVIGGLREIGEPARKAMIVDFAEPHLRARTVGLYYLIRSLTVTPAAAIGGLLWTGVSPMTPFVTAGVIGIIGTLVFAATVEEHYAS